MNLFLEALKLAAKNVLVNEVVDEETAAERFKACVGCDKRILSTNQCVICNCFLDIKCGAKTNFNMLRARNEITHCPLGKWGDVEIANIYREIDGKQLLNNN